MQHPATLSTAALAALSFAAYAQKEAPTDASNVFKKASPSIVVVRTARADGSPYKQGSGVVVAKGQVATNCHVVEGSSAITVGTADGPAAATLSRGDAAKDLCVLAVPTGSMPAADIRPAKSMAIGETVFAIGWPKGLELTLSSGLVSQLRGVESPVIQTTAAISPGSSGGGLFDSKGKLVGITTFKVEGGEALNFASPADWIASLGPVSVEKLAQDSRAKRGAAIKALLESRQFKEAARQSQEWADEDPGFFRPHWLMGLAFAQMDLYEAAVVEYQKAIDLKPDQSDSWRLKGSALIGLRKNAAAIVSLKEALRLNPADSEAWGLLSSAYQNERQTDNALAAINKALEIKETDMDYRWLAHLLQVAENNKTDKDLSGPDAFKPGHVGYKQDRSQILLAWRKAAQVGPRNPENLTGLIGALDQESKCDEVAQAFGMLKAVDQVAAIEYASKHARPSLYVKCPIAPQ